MKSWLTTPVIVLALFCIAWSSIAAEQALWVQIDNMVYGAKPDRLGPLGGGNGYANIITKGDYTVKDLDALVNALSKATTGQIVFIPGETELDLTARIHIEQLGNVNRDLQ